MNATGTMLIDLVLLFFIYSLTGWCIEVCLKYIQYHRFINRGFLTGPICPIYGTGAVLITVAVHLLTPFEEARWSRVFYKLVFGETLSCPLVGL